MKKVISLPVLFCSSFLVLVTVLADLNGKWTGTITTPDGQQIEPVYNFKVEGETLTGTAEAPNGTVTIDNGKIKGDDFSFKVTVDGIDYPHTGKVYKDSCSLDIDFGGLKVHTTLKRVTN